MIERPVFIVAPPRSGATVLLRSLARADGIYTAGENGHRVLDSIFELDPANREWDSNRLTQTDVAPRVIESLRTNLKGTLVDRAGRRPGLDASGLRWLDGTPRSALRVPFLNAVCPDALFVYVHREPRQSVREMVGAWRSGSAVTQPDLPGWPGPPWSLPLVPGWRDLAGKEVPEIAVEQWIRTTRTLLDDLEKLPPERWCVADWSALLRNPGDELERLFAFAGIEADADAALPLRSLRDELADAESTKGDQLDQELEPFLPRTEKLDERAREWLARPASAAKAPATPQSDSPLRSVYTTGSAGSGRSTPSRGRPPASSARETATFGGLPLMERLDGFEELVQEIFDVALLPGLRYPEIADEASDAASQSFALP